jgi:hypothetical protein
MKELSSADIDPADALAPVRSVADLTQLMPCSHDLARVAKPSTPISDRVRDAPVLSSMVSCAENMGWHQCNSAQAVDDCAML